MNSTIAFVSRSGWLRWLVIAACVPIIAVLIGLVMVGVREFRASSQLQTKLIELKQQNQPYDNASLEQWYRNNTHSEGTQAWVQILESVSATSQLGAVSFLPFVGNEKELSDLDPQTEWRVEPSVKEYLTEMQGLIQQIHKLAQWPSPVQFPVEFEGVGTLLPHYQQSRALTRLLQLDFEYAFHNREFDRALQDLRSIGTVAKAIDSKLFLVVDLIVSATLQSQYSEIQRSVLTENWPPEQLNELRALVGQIRHNSENWKMLFISERATFGDDVASGDLSRITGTKEASLVPIMNSGRLRIFEAYDSLIQIANADFADWKSASKSAVGRIVDRDATFDVDGANAWIAMIFPAVEQMAQAMENEESIRRLTLTAIALRQYKHQEGSWPSRLNELEKVGLSQPNYSTVNRGTFGYEVTDGIAYLWGNEWIGDLPVKSTRPTGDLSSSTVKVLAFR